MQPRLLVPLLLVTAALAVAAPAAAEDGDAQGLRPILSEVEATYGPEGWKDVNATLGSTTSGSSLPTVPGASATGVYKNPYSSPDHGHQPPAGTYLGYKLDANLTLRTSDGESPPDDKNYVVDARVESAAGQVPTRLAKLSNDTFEIVADLDGENRHAYPALALGGSASLDVEVYEDPPTADPQLVASESYTLDLSRGAIQAPADPFPENLAPDHDDIGATNSTDLYPDIVAPDERVEVTFGFPGASGEPVEARLLRGTDGPLVFTGTTGPNGTVTFSFTPGQALPEVDDSGLLVLEAHLEGPAGAPAGATALGSKPVLLPVTPNPMTVTSIQHRGRSDTSFEGSSTVQVTVEDSNENPNNNSRQGSLYVLKGSDVVAEASFGPSASGDPSTRTARFPASAIQEPRYTSYDLTALFFDDQGDFYSLASAERGADARLSVGDAAPNEQTLLSVSVANQNDNRNGETDPGLVITGEVLVRDLPGTEGVVRDEVIAPEGEVRTAEIPFTPPDVGTHEFTVNVTAGEIAIDLVRTVSVEETGPVEELLSEDDLSEAPGPAAPAIAAVLAGVSAALRRRP